MSEREFDASKVVNQFATMLFVMDVQGIIKWVSDFGASQLGYLVLELIDKLVLEVFHPDDRENVLKQFQKCIENPGVVFRWRFRKVKKDGSIIWVGESARCFVDEGGNYLVLVSCEDISEVVRSEESLKESEERYRLLFEESGDGILVLETKKNTFVKCNKAARTILGVENESFIIGKHPSSISPLMQDDGMFSRSKADALVKETLNDGTSSFEWIHRKSDGKAVFLDVTLTAIKSQGEMFIHITWKDITEKKQFERNMLQTQKIEAIGRLAGGVAHDFNNILTVILGYGEIMKMKYSEGSDEYQKIEEITRAAKRGARMTQSLLAFTRNEEPQLKPLNMNNSIRMTEKMLKRLVTEDIEFLVELSPHGELIVNADPTQMDQIMINLVTNARDALGNGNGGKIIIKTEMVSKPSIFSDSIMVAEKYCKISVLDDGMGMDEETKYRIFDPFFTTKEAGKGTGLGLSIVYGIVKKHGGCIEVDSFLGVGSEFKIYLPIVDEKETGESEKRNKVKGGKETILLVEDNSAVRKMNASLLTEFGYRVVEAVDGEDAVRLFHKNHEKVSLIVSDVVMPRKNGKEMMDEIRNSGFSDIKFLFLSGYTQDILSEKGINGGGIICLGKTEGPNDLLAKIREILDK